MWETMASIETYTSEQKMDIQVVHYMGTISNEWYNITLVEKMGKTTLTLNLSPEEYLQLCTITRCNHVAGTIASNHDEVK